MSDRDKQILQFLSNGYTNSEIAAELHLSVRSIETNLSKIYKKLQVKSRLEAVKQGYAIGFIK
ncbi:helix-turn-helix transcriptional regulator [Paenibacillus sp. MSJ-34]|nr:helix-turn-helix transcriptional regulator [Paenibacillus sp. MSJ-34]